MQPGGGQAEDDVALFDRILWQERPALRRADGKAGEIVIAVAVHARHFSGLTADQRGACALAAVGNAGDDRLGGLRLKFAAGEIVEKEERLGALNDEVVYAHGHQIVTDAVVNAGLTGQLQLGADTVGGGAEDRVFEARGLEVEQPTETAEVCVGAGARGCLRQGLDGLDKRIAGGNIDAGIPVAVGFLLGQGRLPNANWPAQYPADLPLASRNIATLLPKIGRTYTLARPAGEPAFIPGCQGL